jgi:hypothetical protein
VFNPLNAELNPICHLLALLGTHHILHVRKMGVKLSFCISRIRMGMYSPSLSVCYELSAPVLSLSSPD